MREGLQPTTHYITVFSNRIKKTEKNERKSELSENTFLPGFEDELRVLPNHLARSSLFAPIQRGRRERHNKTEIASRNDVRILYSGLQLDEADRDVFLQLLYEARSVPLGKRVHINHARFLKSLGRSTGKNDYEWLRSTFERFFTSALYVETKRYRVGRSTVRSEDWMHLVERVSFDEAVGSYYFELDPRIRLLFHNSEYSLIDWEKRMSIQKRIDMAKWLQCLIATSRNPTQKYRIDDIRAWMASSTPLRMFKPRLIEALKELERLKIIGNPHYEQGTRGQDLVVWKRTNLHRDSSSLPSG
jgi:hypothetical protein